ncbi:MAG: hypothetical protein MRK00_16270 [Nitrosomonas sp.]|nr:hypothetical protein [Nitrosomonas sp.]
MNQRWCCDNPSLAQILSRYSQETGDVNLYAIRAEMIPEFIAELKEYFAADRIGGDQ